MRMRRQSRRSAFNRVHVEVGYKMFFPGISRSFLLTIVAVGLTVPFSSRLAGASELHSNAPVTVSPLRGGRTPQELMQQRMAKMLKADAARKSVRAQDQEVIDFPEFLSAPQFNATGSDTQPIYVSAEGDINGDGTPDIVTVNEDGAVNVFLNNAGALTLAYTDTSLVSAGGHSIFELAVADLNGDGRADVVAMDLATGQFFVWLASSNGSLAAPVSYSMKPQTGGTVTRGGGLALADMNGDGHVDVVIATASLSANTTVALQSFPGKGDGTFGAPVESDTTLKDYYYMEFGPSLALADVNGDGKLDAVLLLDDEGKTTTAGIGVMTATGNGTGGFSTLSGYSGAFVGSGANNKFYETSNLVAADFNGDGITDVLFGDGAGNLYVAINSGSRTFNAASVAIATGEDNIFVQAGDLNGDKKTDVVVLGDGFVSAYLGNGDGTFKSPNSYPAELGVGHQQPDLAAYGGANSGLGVVYVGEELNSGAILLGNGDGTLAGAPTLVPPGELLQNVVVFASGDLNGDGVPDFLAFDYTHAQDADNPNQVPDIVSLISNGKGGLKSSAIAVPLSYLVNANASYVLAEPMAVDLNGDGKADLLLSLGDDLEIAYGNGDGTFKTPSVLSLGSSFGAATLDCPPGAASAGKGSDGVLEFVVAYGGDDGCYASGSQQSGVFVFTDGGAQVSFVPIGSAIADAKLADLNGDGILDLVTNDEDGVNLTYAVYATEGTGNAQFNVNATNVVSQGYAVNAILTGDYNGDGKNDLALLSSGLVDPQGFIYDNTGGVLLIPGNNDGTFGTTTLADGGVVVAAGAWADFNGNGMPDLAVSQFAGYALNPYLNLYVGTYNFAVLPNVENGSFPAAESYPSLSGNSLFTGDYNGDGELDAAIPEYAGGVSLYLNARPKPGITLSITPASFSLTQGATGIATLQVAANAAFSGVVALSCSGAPANSTCTVNPDSATLMANQNATVTVVVATTAPSLQTSRNSPPAWMPLAGATPLALACTLLWPGRRRLRRFAAVLLFAVLVGMGALTGCGGGSSKPVPTGGTPIGQSTITVTATSGTITQTMQIAVTVAAQ